MRGERGQVAVATGGLQGEQRVAAAGVMLLFRPSPQRADPPDESLIALPCDGERSVSTHDHHRRARPLGVIARMTEGAAA